jgi:hypothetical protein
MLRKHRITMKLPGAIICIEQQGDAVPKSKN